MKCLQSDSRQLLDDRKRGERHDKWHSTNIPNGTQTVLTREPPGVSVLALTKVPVGQYKKQLVMTDRCTLPDHQICASTETGS